MCRPTFGHSQLLLTLVGSMDFSIPLHATKTILLRSVKLLDGSRTAVSKQKKIYSISFIGADPDGVPHHVTLHLME